jgi:hypothetical protein
MSSIANNSATPAIGPNNIPPLTMHFETRNTRFSHLSATILPRLRSSALCAYFTFQFRDSPISARLKATRLILHSRIPPTPPSTQTTPPVQASPVPEPPAAPLPLRVTIAACKGRDNSFRVMDPPLTSLGDETDLIRDGGHIILNDRMHVQIVGHHELFANVVVFAGREEYSGQIIELWTPRVWAVVSERARMGLLTDTSTLHSHLPNVHENCDPFSPFPHHT